MIITGLAAIAASAALQSSAVYEVEVIYQEKRGLRSRTIKLKEDVDLADGEFTIGEEELSGAPLLIGESAVDDASGEIAVEMTLCTFGSSPCEAIATPELTLDVGKRATVRAQTRSGIYYRITLRPQ